MTGVLMLWAAILLSWLSIVGAYWLVMSTHRAPGYVPQPYVSESKPCADCGGTHLLDANHRCDLCAAIAEAEARFYWGRE
jgi:hypothetical protein